MMITCLFTRQKLTTYCDIFDGRRVNTLKLMTVVLNDRFNIQ